MPIRDEMDDVFKDEALDLLLPRIPGGAVCFVAGGGEEDGSGHDWPVVAVDDRMLKYLGYSREDFTDSFGQNFIEAVYPADRDALRRAVSGALASGGEYELRHRIVRMGPGRRPETSWVVHRGRDGGGAGKSGTVLGVFTDVAEVVELREELLAKTQELERSMAVRAEQERKLQDAMDAVRAASQARNTFLATMSHEIRTPMNGVIGFAELAMDDPDLPPRARDYVQKIKQSAAGLLGVINDILDIAKLESGNIQADRAAFRLAPVIRQCETLMSLRAAEKGVRLVVEQDLADNPEMLGDPAKLRQVLINLLSNAVKFTRKGTVTLRVRVNELSTQGYSAYFEVVDTGVGMTQEEIGRVFLPFVQADGGTTRQHGGTGLGLTISKRYIEMLGGELKVASVPGAGTRFSFALEFDRSDAADVPGGPHDGAQSLKAGRPLFSARVLVCEDNESNREVIREHLAGCGIIPDEAVNGRIGVEMARERMRLARPYDLILMDVFMPEVDGLDALRQLRLAGVMTPVVAMTANVQPEDQAAYREQGMADCLGKPFVAKELWSCLLKFLTPAKWLPYPPGPGSSPTSVLRRRPALDRTVALRLLDRLELLLRSGDAMVLEDTGSIRDVLAPMGGGCESLVEQIEAYDFEDAMQTIRGLRKDVELTE